MTYHRYMRGMSNGGAVAATDETGIDREVMAACVPSIFATGAHESRSERFVPIPTIQVVDGLQSAGFVPMYAQQSRTRVPGKAAYTRHMIRLRHRSLENAQGRAFEVILTNANDGTASYQMLAGVFRFVCLNGLFTGDAFAPVKVRHFGKNVVEAVKDGAMEILEKAPEALALTEEMKATPVSRDIALAYAQAAHLARFPKAYKADETGAPKLMVEHVAPVKPADLLMPRRTADRHETVWHMLNVVQENTVRGGLRGLVKNTKGKLRRASVRAVTGIEQQRKLNGLLWDMAVAVVGGRIAA